MRQGFAMKKRIFISLGIVVLIFIGVACYFFPWRWFSLAGDVVNETLMAANEGRYGEASQNLSEIRRSYQAGPAEEKALWDSITRNGTISKVVIHYETKSVGQQSADVSLEIHYRDGLVIHTNEGCDFEHGRWKLSLGLIMKAVYEEQARQAKQKEEKARAIPLDDTYTNVDGTGVIVRLPTFPTARWPPGSYALASAAAAVIEAMAGRSRRRAICFVAPDTSSGTRTRAAALPVRLARDGIAEVMMPMLSHAEQIGLDNAMML